jgi:hypothetical protein
MRHGLLAAIVGIGCLAGVSEVGLRFLLFHPSDLARKLGGGFRRPERYADPLSEDAYWKLRYLFTDPTARAESPVEPDPVRDIDLRGRRPVLLFGDSFADCGTPPSRCFEGVLARSQLADRFCLVNYGVAEHGLDQELLLLKQSIDRWKDLDPIVVLGVPVGDALYRCSLAFTEGPKPRLSVEGGELAVELPQELDPELFIVRHPIGIRSYLWRLLARPWCGNDGPREQVAPLVAKILEEMHEELRARSIPHFALAFETDGTSDWAAALVETTAAHLELPLVHTRPFLAAANATGSGDLVTTRNRFEACYTELGNLVAFEALRQGIEGRFGAEDVSGVAGLMGSKARTADWRIEKPLFDCPTWCAGSGPSTLVRFARMPYPPFDAQAREDYLILRPGASEPLRIVLVPRGERRHLRGRATLVAGRNADGRSGPSDLVLCVRLDERLALRSEVPAWPAGLDLDLDLAGASEVEIAAERTGNAPGSPWIHLAGARLE